MKVPNEILELLNGKSIILEKLLGRKDINPVSDFGFFIRRMIAEGCYGMHITYEGTKGKLCATTSLGHTYATAPIDELQSELSSLLMPGGKPIEFPIGLVEFIKKKKPTNWNQPVSTYYLKRAVAGLIAHSVGHSKDLIGNKRKAANDRIAEMRKWCAIFEAVKQGGELTLRGDYVAIKDGRDASGYVYSIPYQPVADEEAPITPLEPAAYPIPSAEEINALPSHVRHYITQLETDCDPSGTIRENVFLKETNQSLQKHIEEIDAEHEAVTKQLADKQKELESAWFNRDRFCGAINVIGKQIIGPHINSFKSDNCSEEAVVRETRKLVDTLTDQLKGRDKDLADVRQELLKANDLANSLSQTLSQKNSECIDLRAERNHTTLLVRTQSAALSRTQKDRRITLVAALLSNPNFAPEENQTSRGYEAINQANWLLKQF